MHFGHRSKNAEHDGMWVAVHPEMRGFGRFAIFIKLTDSTVVVRCQSSPPFLRDPRIIQRSSGTWFALMPIESSLHRSPHALALSVCYIDVTSTKSAATPSECFCPSRALTSCSFSSGLIPGGHVFHGQFAAAELGFKHFPCTLWLYDEGYQMHGHGHSQ